MKTKIVLLNLMAALLCGINCLTAQIDLVPGINYGYNPPGANGIIQVVNEDVCNNGAGAAGSFDVANYIYNTSTHNVYVVGDTTLTGINGNACITIYNRYMNINNTPGVPAGTYELGEWVNSQQMVTETDSSNNAGLFSGSFSYKPDAINEVKANTENISLYPNPGNGIYTIKSDKALTGDVIKVYSTLGQKVYSAPLIAGENKVDLSAAPKGLYFYNILNEQGAFMASGKVIIQ